MSKPSAGGLVGRLPRATPSLRSASSCASPTSATSSSSSSASSVVVISQVADNFTLPAASSTLTPPAHARLLEPLPDHDAASDACSCSTAPEGGGRSDEFELVPAATARRAAFWRYVRVVALAVRAAVLAATLAVVVAADVALAVHLFPRRGTA